LALNGDKAASIDLILKLSKAHQTKADLDKKIWNNRLTCKFTLRKEVGERGQQQF